MTHVPPDINEIIDTFADYGFDDFNAARKYQEKLFKDEKPSDDIPNETIRNIMKRELEAFKKKIDEHKAREFYLQDTFDDKYGHVKVLHWIFSRWFMSFGPDDYNKLPEWYRDLLDIVDPPKRNSFYNVHTETRNCAELVDACLNYLKVAN